MLWGAWYAVAPGAAGLPGSCTVAMRIKDMGPRWCCGATPKHQAPVAYVQPVATQYNDTSNGSVVQQAVFRYRCSQHPPP